jgi:4-carboxymuconolactone decarboxylase
MRLTEPRIAPIDLDHATAEQRELLAPFSETLGQLNIFKTMVRRPKAFKRFNLWGGYILGRGTSLDPREREIAILRTAWLCRSGYEWVQHSEIGMNCGLSAAEIERIKSGGDADGWSPREAAILHTADDIVADQFVTDERWAKLEIFSEAERMDIIYTIGQYVLVATILNSFGVQLEDGQVLEEDFPG